MLISTSRAWGTPIDSSSDCRGMREEGRVQAPVELVLDGHRHTHVAPVTMWCSEGLPNCHSGRPGHSGPLIEQKFLHPTYFHRKREAVVMRPERCLGKQLGLGRARLIQLGQDPKTLAPQFF